MKKTSKKAKTLISTGVVIALTAVYFIYQQWVSPTVIGFINYPDYMFAKFDSANDNSFIRVERINWKKGEETNLKKYDAVYIFGMGLRLPPEKITELKNAVNDSLAVYVYAATSQENNITSIQGKDLQYIEKCLGNSTRNNFKLLLNYTRRVIDGKKLFSDDIQEPRVLPHDGFFHIGEDKLFESLETYEAYRRKSNLHRQNAPKVCFLTSTAGPDSEHIQAIVNEFEKNSINIYPIFGFRKRLDFIRQVSPDMVILMPHGRFTTDKDNEVINYLKTRNIPLLCPINIHKPYETWVKDQRGMDGGIMSQSVIMPELDGGIIPFVLSAQFKNKRGLYVFKPLPRRIKRFASMARKYLELKKKSNKDKKLVIVYYKGPGLNALHAAGLEVVPSLFNTLQKLKQAGYNTGKLPDNPDELFKAIQAAAPVFNPYAAGSINQYIDQAKPLQLKAETYRQWALQAFPADLYADVVKRYGEAPGPYMNRDGKLIVSNLRYGNITLMPQPLPGYGDNTSKLIHGARQAPPHPYIAAYLWARFGFKADAIIHFGTHGSLEFTPWKQTALSDYDWPDVLIGDMPHFYIYTINNIGEAIIAKRRSYAALVSHLTPPFMRSGLYSELDQLHDKLHECLSVKDKPLLLNQYKQTILSLVKKLNLNKDLKINKIDSLTPETLAKIHNYIHELEEAKVNRGLYVLNRPYSDKEANETAELMAVDAVATGLADIDLTKGRITGEQKNDRHFFNEKYLEPATRIIHDILKGDKPEKHLSSSDLENYKNSPLNRKSGGQVNMMAMMIGMQANADEDRSKSARTMASDNSTEKLKSLLLANCKKPENINFIRSFENSKAFDRISSLTNPRNLTRARRMAQLIPKMKKTIDIATQPQMLELIRLVSDKQQMKKLFKLLNDQDIIARLQAEKQNIIEQNMNRALDNKNMKITYAALSPGFAASLKSSGINDMKLLKRKMAEIKRIKSIINFQLSMRQHAKLIEKNKSSHAKNLSKILTSSEKTLKKAIEICDKEYKTASSRYNNYLHAIKAAMTAMRGVSEYKQALLDSTKAETKSLINALNGGYIAPSPGADPIKNPMSVPTGRNLFSIDTESTPTREAWATAIKLGDALIKAKLSANGKYPKKVAFSLWGGEFIRSYGTNVAEILYLLGVEPVWNSRGRVRDIRLIPAKDLKRPRIDVIVQTSGQFRGAATSRLYLIDKAVRLAAAADDGDEFTNYVKAGNIAAEKVLLEKGYSPVDARKLSNARIFGGVNGNFGTGIMGMVESGSKWEKEQEIADRYMKNMGAMYTRDNWCEFRPGIFEAAVQNTDTVVQPRSSNTWGPLSLDHVYEFMGGMNLTVKKVTGNSPDIVFNDLRNPNAARIQDAKEAAMVEARSTVLNPKYLKEMMQEGANAAESVAEVTRNSYGWEVMRPEMLEDYYWQDMKDTIVDDKHKLGLKKFFDRKNPYAMQEITAVMLETIRKGYWKADEQTRRDLARKHVESVLKHSPGCSGFVCDNPKLRNMISNLLQDKNLRKQYNTKVEKVRNAGPSGKKPVKGMQLKKVEARKLEQIIRNNAAALIAIGTIILLIIASVIIGNIRRKNS